MINIQCFIGPPGSGKTNLLMKCSALCMRNLKRNPDAIKPHLYDLNTWNIGSGEPLERYASIVGLKYRKIESLSKEMLKENTSIFIDTPGTHSSNEKYFEIIQNAVAILENVKVILVLDANYRIDILQDIIRFYKQVVHVDCLAFTRCQSVNEIPGIVGEDIPKTEYIAGDDKIPGHLEILSFHKDNI